MVEIFRMSKRLLQKRGVLETHTGRKYNSHWSKTDRSNSPLVAELQSCIYLYMYSKVEKIVFVHLFENRQSNHFFNRSWFKDEIINLYSLLARRKSGLDLGE